MQERTQRRALVLASLVLATMLALLGNLWLETGTVKAADPTTYSNPVIQTNFPDPDVIQANGQYYVYATNGNNENIQIARSADLINWTQLPDALPTVGSWAKGGLGLTWAPGVIQIGDQYNMYYVSRDIQSDKQCVGVATSASPEGPFKDANDHAFVCQADQGGTIDPSAFYDGDTLYLYFKNDGNCCSLPVHLYVQQLSSDGLSLVGDPTSLVQNDQQWEGNLVEAPYMFKHNDKYYLFFSANNYADGSYATGYALCQSATGPCQQAAENPILSSDSKQTPPLIGPGGETLIQVGDQTWMLYHEWNVNADGSQGDARYMAVDKVNWPDDKPVVAVNGATPAN